MKMVPVRRRAGGHSGIKGEKIEGRPGRGGPLVSGVKLLQGARLGAQGSEDAPSQQHHAGLLTGPDGVGVPQGTLHLTDVGLAQQQHGHPGLADAAPHGQGAAHR